MQRRLSILFRCFVWLAAFGIAGCRREEKPASAPTPSAPPPSVAANLSPLGKAPDWSQLEPLQNTITREEFELLLTSVFALPDAWKTTITISETSAAIRRETANERGGVFVLQFATGSPAQPPRYWRRAVELLPLRDPALPLEGLHVALDPGHIGGKWALMEERSWSPDDKQPPIQEGEITLTTALLLKSMLEELGAKVSMIRAKTEPTTPLRPADFLEVARKDLAQPGRAAEPPSERRDQRQAERLFYRTAEIRARAALVNDVLKPDVVVCLHFDAAPWETSRTFSTENHLHLIVNGAFGMDELLLDDQRFEMLAKLLEGAHHEEAALANAVAQSLATTTGLPPYVYTNGRALPVPPNPYVWARNLLANRLYRCPVVYCEPYVMNNRHVYSRVMAGDFSGEVEVEGKLQRSIFREYAMGVAQGLKAFYTNARKANP